MLNSKLSVAAIALFAITSQQVLKPTLTKDQAEILSHLSLVELSDGQGGLRKTIRITGVNVQIVNGLGATNGRPGAPTSNDPTITQTNGLGNLIIGYDDLPRNQQLPLFRTGSHNLVIGFGHNYPSYGGQVVGYENTIDGAYAVVSAGAGNRATAEFATVSGGISNLASGVDAAVSGGIQNEATGFGASITGGLVNRATADFAAVCGGQDNEAAGSSSTISGGGFNRATGWMSTVGGGSSRTVTGDFDWGGGSLLEDF